MTLLGSFIHGTRWSDVPADARRQVRFCLLDTLAAAIAGRGTPLSRIVHDFVGESFGGADARLWQDGRRVSAPGAALANGMTIDALDIHDGHSLTKGHAGAAVVPALFAISGPPSPRLSGLECLTSLAVGYEVALRAGMALHATAHEYHSSGAWNALGCAALAARRFGLDDRQSGHALGIAEYHGPRSPIMRCVDHPTMLKDGSGWGAMAGICAAQLARRGFTGAPAATVESGESRPAWQGLGDSWRLLDVYFKPHAVCRWAQPAVEAVLELRRRHGLRSEDVRSIRVETFHEATRLATRAPTTTEEAQYSLPFPVAAACVHGELGPRQLIGAALGDERVRRIESLVEIAERPDYNRAFPARRLATVTVHARDGRTLTIEHVEPRWEADSGPTDAEFVDKFRRLTADLPAGDVRDLEQLILGVDDLPDVAVLDHRLASLAAPRADPS